MVYKGFVSYPEHVEYFNTYVDDPGLIAKHPIPKIRGGLCTITSAAAEQTHSKNEVVVPTKTMDILAGLKRYMGTLLLCIFANSPLYSKLFDSPMITCTVL